MSATEFFDQFTPALDGSTVRGNGQWCARHWAPCPLLHANGIGASLELMQVWLTTQAAVGERSADAMNARMAEGGPVCCQLGDERMYELWCHWPPAQEPRTDS